MVTWITLLIGNLVQNHTGRKGAKSEKTHSKTRPAKPHGRVGSKETRPESPGTIPPDGLPSGKDGPGAGETDRKKDGSRIPERKVWEKA